MSGWAFGSLLGFIGLFVSVAEQDWSEACAWAAAIGAGVCHVLRDRY